MQTENLLATGTQAVSCAQDACCRKEREPIMPPHMCSVHDRFFCTLDLSIMGSYCYSQFAIMLAVAMGGVHWGRVPWVRVARCWFLFLLFFF